MRHQFLRALCGGCTLAAVVALAACSSPSGSTSTGNSATATTAPTATATPQSPCTQIVPGATPFSSLSGAPGIQVPAGSYISAGASSGGGSGQYAIETYTLCFQGAESAINGGPPAQQTSTFVQLENNGWTLNNLFPDPSNFSYLDYCSNAHNCLNTSGSGAPFTFIGFNQYASHAGGYTTVQIQVATIAAPTCLNDPNYYSGTPKYTLYYDGNGAGNKGNPQNHFLMPPATRVSTYQGGGTAGSTYVFYCSAGTQASVVSFLSSAMQNIGWTISNPSSNGFSATEGGGVYRIDISVQNPNNYYLRVFVPM